MPYLEYSPEPEFEAISIAAKICPGNSPLLPPPVASNPSVAPVSIKAVTKVSLKFSSLVLQTYFAPMFFKRSTCSCVLTMFTSGMSSSLQIFTSICPKLEAAAVLTIPE